MISAESDVRRHCFASFQPAQPETALKAFSLAHMAYSADTEFSSPAAAPARKTDRMHAHCARFRSPYAAQDKPSSLGSTNPDRKGCDIMFKINYMSTLFVGIDVSPKSNTVYAMDFDENMYFSSSFGNNQPGAEKLVNMISDCMQNHKNLDTVLIVLESTSVYSIHISSFLPFPDKLPDILVVWCLVSSALSISLPLL